MNRSIMDFYGGNRYSSPTKKRRDRLRKQKFVTQLSRGPELVPVPLHGPAYSPSPSTYSGPVPAIVVVLATELMIHSAQMLLQELRAAAGAAYPGDESG